MNNKKKLIEKSRNIILLKSINIEKIELKIRELAKEFYSINKKKLYQFLENVKFESIT